MRAVVVVVLLARVAVADPAGPRPEDKAEADRLFEEGRQLLAAGNRVDACKRFDASFAKDPRAVGTMLNLGLCREEGGAIASASRFYAEARDRAHEQDLKEHYAAAERKLAMLAPRIPHLQIVIPPDLAPTARVLVDELVLGPDQLGDVPVDPGPHAIVVTAPGKLPFETKIDVKERERREVRVPRLEGAKTIIVHSSSRRTYGKIGVAVGAGLGLAAVGLGLYARALYWDQFPAASRDGLLARDPMHDCWTTGTAGNVVRECNANGSSKLDTARSLAHVSTATGILAGVALVGGLALWLGAPAETRTTIAVDVTNSEATVGLAGAF